MANNNLIFYYSFYSILSLSLAVISFYRSKDFLDPRPLFLIVYWLSWSSGLYDVIFINKINRLFVFENLNEMLLIMPLAMFVYWAASTLILKKKSLVKKFELQQHIYFLINTRNALYLITLVLVIAHVFFAAYFFTKDILYVQYKNVFSNEMLFVYIFIQKYWFFFLIMLISVDALMGKESRAYNIIFLVSVAVLASFLLGERNATFALFLCALIYRNNKISSKHSFYIALSAVAAYNLTLVIRNYGLSETEVSQVYEYYKNPFPRIGANIVVFSNVIEMVPRQFPFFFGKTFFYSILDFLPFELYPRENFAAALWFEKNFIYQAGSGFDFCLEAESYINFGWIGVPVIFGIISLVYSKFYRMYKYGNVLFYKVIYPPLFLILLMSVRTASLGLIKAVAAYCLLYYGFRFLHTALKRQKAKF